MAPPIAAQLLAFALLVTAVSAAETGYHNHTVGGGTGWSFNSTTNTSATNYSSWASTQTFDLGDYLSKYSLFSLLITLLFYFL